MKQAQMEIMGLVVIVILLTLGMLFMALFAFDDHVEKSVFTRKGLATSTLSALFKTTIDQSAACAVSYGGAADLAKLGEDILEDCALFWEEYSDNGPISFSQYRCSGTHSCQFFQDTTAHFLGQTLGAWGKQYELRSVFITSTSEQPMFTILDPQGKGCPGERDSSGLFPIQVRDSGVVETQLFVCG